MNTNNYYELMKILIICSKWTSWISENILSFLQSSFYFFVVIKFKAFYSPFSVTQYIVVEVYKLDKRSIR